MEASELEYDNLDAGFLNINQTKCSNSYLQKQVEESHVKDSEVYCEKEIEETCVKPNMDSAGKHQNLRRAVVTALQNWPLKVNGVERTRKPKASPNLYHADYGGPVTELSHSDIRKKENVDEVPKNLPNDCNGDKISGMLGRAALLVGRLWLGASKETKAENAEAVKGAEDLYEEICDADIPTALNQRASIAKSLVQSIKNESFDSGKSMSNDPGHGIKSIGHPTVKAKLVLPLISKTEKDRKPKLRKRVSDLTKKMMPKVIIPRKTNNLQKKTAFIPGANIDLDKCLDVLRLNDPVNAGSSSAPQFAEKNEIENYQTEGDLYEEVTDTAHGVDENPNQTNKFPSIDSPSEKIEIPSRPSKANENLNSLEKSTGLIQSSSSFKSSEECILQDAEADQDDLYEEVDNGNLVSSSRQPSNGRFTPNKFNQCVVLESKFQKPKVLKFAKSKGKKISSFSIRKIYKHKFRRSDSKDQKEVWNEKRQETVTAVDDLQYSENKAQTSVGFSHKNEANTNFGVITNQECEAYDEIVFAEPSRISTAEDFYDEIEIHFPPSAQILHKESIGDRHQVLDVSAHNTKAQAKVKEDCGKVIAENRVDPNFPNMRVGITNSNTTAENLKSEIHDNASTTCQDRTANRSSSGESFYVKRSNEVARPKPGGKVEDLYENTIDKTVPIQQNPPAGDAPPPVPPKKHSNVGCAPPNVDKKSEFDNRLTPEATKPRSFESSRRQFSSDLRQYIDDPAKVANCKVDILSALIDSQETNRNKEFITLMTNLLGQSPKSQNKQCCLQEENSGDSNSVVKGNELPVRRSKSNANRFLGLFRSQTRNNEGFRKSSLPQLKTSSSPKTNNPNYRAVTPIIPSVSTRKALAPFSGVGEENQAPSEFSSREVEEYEALSDYSTYLDENSHTGRHCMKPSSTPVKNAERNFDLFECHEFAGVSRDDSERIFQTSLPQNNYTTVVENNAESSSKIVRIQQWAPNKRLEANQTGQSQITDSVNPSNVVLEPYLKVTSTKEESGCANRMLPDLPATTPQPVSLNNDHINPKSMILPTPSKLTAEPGSIKNIRVLPPIDQCVCLRKWTNTKQTINGCLRPQSLPETVVISRDTSTDNESTKEEARCTNNNITGEPTSESNAFSNMSGQLSIPRNVKPIENAPCSDHINDRIQNISEQNIVSVKNVDSSGGGKETITANLQSPDASAAEPDASPPAAIVEEKLNAVNVPRHNKVCFSGLAEYKSSEVHPDFTVTTSRSLTTTSETKVPPKIPPRPSFVPKIILLQVLNQSTQRHGVAELKSSLQPKKSSLVEKDQMEAIAKATRHDGDEKAEKMSPLRYGDLSLECAQGSTAEFPLNLKDSPTECETPAVAYNCENDFYMRLEDCY